MTESLPDFEAPTVPEAPAPRKSRRKPTKTRATRSSLKKRATGRGSARTKIDKRSKAYRAAHPRAEMNKAVHKTVQPAPKPGEAETVLSILALLANYDVEVKKRVLARAGQLA